MLPSSTRASQSSLPSTCLILRLGTNGGFDDAHLPCNRQTAAQDDLVLRNHGHCGAGDGVQADHALIRSARTHFDFGAHKLADVLVDELGEFRLGNAQQQDRLGMSQNPDAGDACPWCPCRSGSPPACPSRRGCPRCRWTGIRSRSAHDRLPFSLSRLPWPPLSVRPFCSPWPSFLSSSLPLWLSSRCGLFVRRDRLSCSGKPRHKQACPCGGKSCQRQAAHPCMGHTRRDPDRSLTGPAMAPHSFRFRPTASRRWHRTEEVLSGNGRENRQE